MDYTQTIGNCNELECIQAFIKLGFECSVPYGNGAKYDFIVDDGNKLSRIQCKSSHYVTVKGVTDESAIIFSTTCQTVNTKKCTRYQYSDKDIDYFATSFNGKVYVVPVNECSVSKTLRFTPPKNGGTVYNRAEDYLIDRIFSETPSLIKSREEYLNRPKGVNTCEKEVVLEKTLPSVCQTRKCERPSREELKNLIRKESFLKIGKIYGVTDNAIRKWCESYSLPKHKREITNISDEEWITI